MGTCFSHLLEMNSRNFVVASVARNYELGKTSVLTGPEILVGSRRGTFPKSVSESKFNLKCRSAKNLFSLNIETCNSNVLAL